MVHRAVLLANFLAIASASPLYRRDTVTTLKAGDSVDVIASAAGVDLAAVTAANGGANLATVTPGQVITIPAASAAATGASASAAPAATESAAASGSAAPTAAATASGSAAPASDTGAASGAPTPIATATVTAAGVSVPSLASTDGQKNDGAPDAYTFFKGNGKDGWPTRDQWISFDEMFTRNSKVMGQGCPAGVTSNTPDDNDNIKKAILDIAPAAQVDPRFILATIMQESNGCVRVQGTPSGEPGVFNPGLMQTFKGTGTCNVNNTQQLNPCPPDQITQMVIDGAQGTIQAGTAQAGLVQHLNDVGGDAQGQVYYAAAREYNSGSVPDKNALESAGQCGPPRTFGVPCYSSDIANRLMGWVSAPSGCTLTPAASC